MRDVTNVFLINFLSPCSIHRGRSLKLRGYWRQWGFTELRILRLIWEPFECWKLKIKNGTEEGDKLMTMSEHATNNHVTHVECGINSFFFISDTKTKKATTIVAEHWNLLFFPAGWKKILFFFFLAQIYIKKIFFFQRPHQMKLMGKIVVHVQVDHFHYFIVAAAALNMKRFSLYSDMSSYFILYYFIIFFLNWKKKFLSSFFLLFSFNNKVLFSCIYIASGG